MLELTLVRHAATVLNEERRYQGWGDPPLSARGREQALRLGGRLRAERYDRVVASDLRRCLETLSIALPGAAAEVDPRLRELHFGAWDGLTYSEALERHRDAFSRWVADPAGETPPEGEALRGFQARVDEALAALPPTGRVLLLTHGGPIRRIAARALGLSREQAARLEVDACALSCLRIFPDGALLACWNDAAHLEEVA